MHSVLRRLLLPLLCLAATLVASSSASALVIGVGDQTPQMFADPRFLALQIHNARISVAWDTFTNRRETAALDSWLRAARADGVQPLISFDHSFLRSRHRVVPTPAQFAHVLRIIRARYPWIHDFAVWNEANYCGEPTCHHPELVASWYRALRRTCPQCNILAAELLDEPNMIPWVRAFDHALGFQPAIWGLHNYLGANRLQTRSTLALLHDTTSRIWFTETGGLVSRHNNSHADFPQSPAHAALVTHFVFDRLARLSPRIQRIYIYQWNAGPGRREVWDSGLVGPGPRFAPRPAFDVFVRELSRFAGNAPPPGVSAIVLNSLQSALVGGLYGNGDPFAAPVSASLSGVVTVTDLSTGAPVSVFTLSAGQRFVAPVAPGSYSLTGVVLRGLGPVACAPGYAHVPAASKLTIDLVCPPAAPS